MEDSQKMLLGNIMINHAIWVLPIFWHTQISTAKQSILEPNTHGSVVIMMINGLREHVRLKRCVKLKIYGETLVTSENKFPWNSRRMRCVVRIGWLNAKFLIHPLVVSVVKNSTQMDCELVNPMRQTSTTIPVNNHKKRSCHFIVAIWVYRTHFHKPQLGSIRYVACHCNYSIHCNIPHKR